jgi:hypothetical protein
MYEHEQGNRVDGTTPSVLPPVSPGFRLGSNGLPPVQMPCVHVEPEFKTEELMHGRYKI